MQYAHSKQKRMNGARNSSCDCNGNICFLAFSLFFCLPLLMFPVALGLAQYRFNTQFRLDEPGSVLYILHNQCDSIKPLNTICLQYQKQLIFPHVYNIKSLSVRKTKIQPTQANIIRCAILFSKLFASMPRIMMSHIKESTNLNEIKTKMLLRLDIQTGTMENVVPTTNSMNTIDRIQ